MAKMFYTLEEAAAKLGVDPQQVKDMAAAGDLQQFRDGSKLMFKREEIDARSSSGASGGDSGVIPLSGSGDTDAIDLNAESAVPTRRDDPRDETGVSVFDTGEIEPADPLAQTQVTSEGSGADESAIDLSTESVGSGSGLLDLTNESDDTSLGADLLDDIYPGGEAGGSKVGSAAGTGLGSAAGTGVGASGVFDSAVGVEPSGGTQADQSFAGGDTLTAGEPVAAMPAASVAGEEDAGSNGLSVGLLLGATLSLILALMVAISALAGVTSSITTMMTQSTGSLLIWLGGLAAITMIAGVAGMLLGNASSR